LGLVFAVIAARYGFYPMWAVLVNIVIAVYLAVMLTPMAVNIILGQNISAYSYAGFLGLIAVVVFVVLETIAVTFLTGTFDVTLPKIFNNIGAGLLGFLAGVILWGLVCFILLITPGPKQYLTGKLNMTNDLQRMSQMSVYRVCNLVNALSRQSNTGSVQEAIKILLSKTEKKKRIHKPRKTAEPNGIAEPNQIAEPNKTIQAHPPVPRKMRTPNTDPNKPEKSY